MATERLPNFVIIGAMKSGTTSLHRYLAEHPAVSVSRRKETNFFVEEKEWARGLAWYLSQFDPEKPIRGEASPSYTKYPAFGGVAERMHDLIPDARLIYVVREPVSRTVSHYIHNVDKGRESRPFEEAVSSFEKSHYVATSRYYMQLERFLRLYDPEQILVISLEELSSEPRKALRRVARHIGADERHEWSRRTRRSFGSSKGNLEPNLLGKLLNRYARFLYYGARRVAPSLVGSPLKKPDVSPELRARLREFFAPDVKKIRGFAGNGLDGWPPERPDR
jgi:hypothetical protein